MRAPGTLLDDVVVSADGSTVTGVLHFDGDSQAWSTQDGLTWSPAPLPENVALTSRLDATLARSPDGSHVLGWRYTPDGGPHNHSDWVTLEFRLIGPAGAKTLARLVDWRSDEGDYWGALSGDGQVLAVSGERGFLGPVFSLISRDGGSTWWKSLATKVLAWNQDGSWGIGVDEHWPWSYPIILTGDSGSTWTRLPLASPLAESQLALDTVPWRAVFFNGGLVLVNRDQIIVGRTSP